MRLIFLFLYHDHLSQYPTQFLPSYKGVAFERKIRWEQKDTRKTLYYRLLGLEVSKASVKTTTIQFSFSDYGSTRLILLFLLRTIIIH